jgi:hypothetical protein
MAIANRQTKPSFVPQSLTNSNLTVAALRSSTLRRSSKPTPPGAVARSHTSSLPYPGNAPAVTALLGDQSRSTCELVERNRRLARALDGICEKRLLRRSGSVALVGRQRRGFSWPGFIVALVAIPAVRYLALRKIAIAEKIGSRAIRADATEAVTCGWLSFVVVASQEE